MQHQELTGILTEEEIYFRLQILGNYLLKVRVYSTLTGTCVILSTLLHLVKTT